MRLYFQSGELFTTVSASTCDPNVGLTMSCSPCAPYIVSGMTSSPYTALVISAVKEFLKTLLVVYVLAPLLGERITKALTKGSKNFSPVFYRTRRRRR